MSELSFRLEYGTSGPAGFKVPMIVNREGVRRRATEAEAEFWEALQASQRELEELRAKHTKKGKV